MSNGKFNWYDSYVGRENTDPFNIELNQNEKLVFFGDIHEQLDLFEILLSTINEKYSNIKVVSVGDICDKGPGDNFARELYDKFHSNKNYFLIRGNHESKKQKYYQKTGYSKYAKILAELPNVLSFVWPTGYRATCIHAGVTPKHGSWNDLKYNSEILYVRTVDKNNEMIPLVWIKKEDGTEELVPKKPNGIIWHHLYDGRFGYIVSGHDRQKDGVPKFYKNSCNIDTGAYETGVLTAIVIGKNGIIETISKKL